MNKKDAQIKIKENQAIEKSWNEFRHTGLLWFVNTILHTFGWAITIKTDGGNNVKEVFPTRVNYRGFGDDTNTFGYQRVTRYLKNNIDELFKEIED